jgi:membrane protease YdiL (CAAX protease family)
LVISVLWNVFDRKSVFIYDGSLMKKITLLATFSLFAQEEVALVDLTIPATQLEMPAPKFELPKKSPFLAVTLSVIPGLGHAYLGEYATAAELFGSTTVLAGASAIRMPDEARLSCILTAANLCNYTFYAAYRDVRNYNRQEGYAYKMPNDSFQDLSLAPFRPSVLKKPEVWGGILGALALGVTTSYFAFPQDMEMEDGGSMGLSPVVAFPVGIGEEAFFRGFLQPMFSETLTPWGGIAASSITFGALHFTNGLMLPKEERWRYYSFSLPLITTLGAYLGWVSYKNCSLKESVAIHSWYDFALFTASAFATRASIGGLKEFSWSISF